MSIEIHAPNVRPRLVRASVRDTLSFLGDVVLPTFGKGIFLRRPRVVALAERFDLESRAIRRMQWLRAKYGGGPVLLAIPGRSQAVVLTRDHVRRVLEETPDPFSPASAEKRSALAHFEANVSLISSGGDRVERRAFNERVLESGRPVHSMAQRFMSVVAEEAALLGARSGAELSWNDFLPRWQRLVRRIVLGDGASEDRELTDILTRLRAAANWAFFHPGRRALADRFHGRLEEHLARAEAGSLAQLIAAMPKDERTAPTHQVAHWLFAFDPAGMTTYRALALLASHPQELRRAGAEIAAAGAGRTGLPFLRGVILESLRLWPTTPAVLRETTSVTRWPGGLMPAETSILIYAPFFHRDEESLPFADAFVPAMWTGGRPEGEWPFVQFSQGPGICPGRDLVMMVTSAMLATLLEQHDIELLDGERLRPGKPLPATLDQSSLRFRLQRSASCEAAAAE